MQLTAYEIALISGGFGITGALLGALASYRFALRVAGVNFENAIRLAQLGAHKEAANNLRAAFAPHLAAVRLNQDITAVDLQRLLESGADSLTVEMEKFRFYVGPGDLPAYNDACEKYQRIARIRAMNYFDGFEGREPSRVFEEVVSAVLHFATPNPTLQRSYAAMKPPLAR